MLQQKIETDEIFAIIMTSGIEIIAKASSNDKDAIWLSKPYKIILTAQGPAMIPFTMLMDYDTTTESIPLYHSSIASIFPAAGPARNDYIQNSTGIALVAS